MKPITAHSQHHLSSYQSKVVASTTAGFGLENMDVMFLSFALSSIIADLHLSGTQAGLIATITNIGMLLGGVFFGVLADRVGRIKTFTYTIFIFAFATAALFWANSLPLIYLCRFLAGIGAGGEYGIGMTVLAESFPKKQLGRVSSFVGVAGQIGAILAALLAAWILPQFGWHALFLFGLLPVVITFFIRRHLVESTTFTNRTTQPKGQIKALFKTPQLAYQTVALMVMAVVQIAGYFGLMNWLPTMMQQQLHLSVAGSSTWMLATIVGMSAGMLTFGWILDRIGPRIAFGLFLVASALGVYILTLPKDMPTLLLVGALVGYFSNGMFAGYGAVVSRLYPTEVRATANNVIMNVGRCIGGFSSVMIGWLLDHYSMMMVMIFISTLYVISLLVMLTIQNLKAQYYFNH
ncbi:MFS transporter [Latilactobacillus fuchuensis]|jgi:MFS family permease|uniref:Sugar (And other) transporter family protein n=1 Tax=Latilactobacillus fuchuensis TaxID=164393 RepID=A0A2N9DYC7_9LACO|nr:MFS transporter [Latilactobacillus fuchuensis]MCP8856968.1 MFS transporter [Latilactobacillus fuchuensis]SPC40150.1 Sugar (And other) transporter family protein [Latilactobacillus fuchuensis]